jgi:hypothetical protein
MTVRRWTDLDEAFDRLRAEQLAHSTPTEPPAVPPSARWFPGEFHPLVRLADELLHGPLRTWGAKR